MSVVGEAKANRWAAPNKFKKYKTTFFLSNFKPGNEKLCFIVPRVHAEGPVVLYLLTLGRAVWWNLHLMAVNLKSRIMKPNRMALMWIPPPVVMIGNQMH